MPLEEIESSSGEEDEGGDKVAVKDKVVDKVVVAAVAAVAVGGLKGAAAPSAQDQMDWLAIDEKDI